MIFLSVNKRMISKGGIVNMEENIELLKLFATFFILMSIVGFIEFFFGLVHSLPIKSRTEYNSNEFLNCARIIVGGVLYISGMFSSSLFFAAIRITLFAGEAAGGLALSAGIIIIVVACILLKFYSDEKQKGQESPPLKDF